MTRIMPAMAAALAGFGVLVPSVSTRPAWAQQGGGGVPSLAFTQASGCEGLFLYTWNEARSEVLTVRIDRAVVNLVEGVTTIDLASAGGGVVVQVELSDGPRETMPFCSEAGAAAGRSPAVWTAKAGILKISARKRTNALFAPMSVTLEKMVLVSPERTEMRAKRTVRFTAAVSDAP